VRRCRQTAMSGRKRSLPRRARPRGNCRGRGGAWIGRRRRWRAGHPRTRSPTRGRHGRPVEHAELAGGGGRATRHAPKCGRPARRRRRGRLSSLGGPRRRYARSGAGVGRAEARAICVAASPSSVSLPSLDPPRQHCGVDGRRQRGIRFLPARQLDRGLKIQVFTGVDC
jgi:hypothetical protein